MYIVDKNETTKQKLPSSAKNENEYANIWLFKASK
jgi:hypothetical protein